MTITLPDELRAEVEAKAKAGGFRSADDYVAALVAADDPEADDGSDDPGPSDRTPKSREDLERMLDEGMASGPPIRVTPEFWARLTERVLSGKARRPEQPA